MKNCVILSGNLSRIVGLIIACLFLLSPVHSADITRMDFKTPALLRLPNNKVQRIFQDRKGFLWIGTTMGLYRYDGYSVQTYKNDLFNNIRCITEDSFNRLWIGTKGALKILHEDTGEFETYTLGFGSGLNVNALCVTSANDVLIGTDNGLYRYDSRQRKFIRTVMMLNHREFTPSVQTILQDRDGHIWIGTWSDGLWRWDLKTNRLVRYPALNKSKSVHYLFQDSKGGIWAIGWRKGLYRLHFTKNLSHMTYESFKNVPGVAASLQDNMAYCIGEDKSSGTIWVGSRDGLSVTDRDNPGKFENYSPQSFPHPLPYGEIDAFVCDKEGGIWIGSLGGGIFYNNDRRLLSENIALDGRQGGSALSAVSLGAEGTENIWIGVENSPLYVYNLKTRKSVSYLNLPEFSGCNIPMVNSIAQNKATGEMYFAFNGGVAVYRKGKPVKLLNQYNTPYLSGYHVNVLTFDRDNNLFVGSWNGFGYALTDGYSASVTRLKTDDGRELTHFEVQGAMRDRKGRLWLSTVRGLLKVEGDLRRPSSLKAVVCDLSDGINKSPAPLCLYEDDKGGIWIGSDAGLSKYNEVSGKFENMTHVFHLPAQAVYSIEQDQRGEFWLGTNDGLVHLTKKANGVVSQVYTKEDGLSGNYFNKQAAARIGQLLFFGNGHGVVCVNASRNVSYDSYIDVSLTGLSVNGQSVSMLEPSERKRIIKTAPEYCDEITIPASYDDFTLFFSALSYRNGNQIRYAYKIEGLDSRWQHTDSYSHFAHYNQLSSGKYTFLLKAMNDDGQWSKVKSIELNILPPFYATWWAYTIYVLLFLAIGYRLFIYYRGKQALLQTLNMHTTAVYEGNKQPLQIQDIVKDKPTQVSVKKDTEVEVPKMEIPVPDMNDVEIKSANEEFLDKAVSVVKEHLKDEDYNVDRFVSDMSMSKSAVYKRMKALTGMNTSSFIKSIRLKAAIQIMKRNSGVRVSDLAYLVGFSDPKYFSACFKKEYGMTPSEYIDRFLNK